MKKIIFLASFILILSHTTSLHAEPDIFDIDGILSIPEDNDNTDDNILDNINTTEDNKISENITNDKLSMLNTEKEMDEQHAESLSSVASENNNSDYFNEYFQDMDAAKDAQDGASRLLNQKPNIISLRDSQKRLIKEGNEKRRLLAEKKQEMENEIKAKQDEKITKEERIEKISSEYKNAPFGLYWDISKSQSERIGFKLQLAERKDYQNVYLITNPQQKNKIFDIVTAVYGEQDRLWCIFAQSIPQEDTPNASKVLELYHKYYNALEQKYGNAQQFFTPNTYTEEIIDEADENEKTTVITKSNPLGNPNFLEELKEGTAVLYATFENSDLGITLGVSVDGNNKSYISLDYKNLKIMKQEQDTKLDNLINDI